MILKRKYHSEKIPESVFFLSKNFENDTSLLITLRRVGVCDHTSYLAKFILDRRCRLIFSKQWATYIIHIKTPRNKKRYFSQFWEQPWCTYFVDDVWVADHIMLLRDIIACNWGLWRGGVTAVTRPSFNAGKYRHNLLISIVSLRTSWVYCCFFLLRRSLSNFSYQRSSQGLVDGLFQHVFPDFFEPESGKITLWMF